MTNSPEGDDVSPAIEWQTRTIGDLSELAQARVEAINIVQWLARIAGSYASAGMPNCPTHLRFRPYDAAIVTSQFDKGIALAMRLPTLELQFLDNGRRVPHVFNPEEHSPAELEAWILVELLHRGIDRDKFSKALPYTVPSLLTGDAEDYSPQLCRDGLVRLTTIMQDAAAVLNVAARSVGNDESCITCLPQTLNLMNTADSTAEIGHFAFSPGRVESPEPYFYLSDGLGNNPSALAIKASTLMAESSPTTAALKLKRLVLA